MDSDSYIRLGGCVLHKVDHSEGFHYWARGRCQGKASRKVAVDYIYRASDDSLFTTGWVYGRRVRVRNSHGQPGDYDNSFTGTFDGARVTGWGTWLNNSVNWQVIHLRVGSRSIVCQVHQRLDERWDPPFFTTGGGTRLSPADPAYGLCVALGTWAG